MTRVAIYCRISDDREGAGLGVARQEADCRALAERLGWSVVEVYTDNDISAYSGKTRPDYERLLTDVEAGAVDALIAWHADRLHRSPKELERFIDLAEKTGLRVQTVQAGSVDLSTPSGRMVARMLGAAARYESEHKAARIRAKVDELAAAGSIYGGGPRPFGYTRIYSGEGTRRKIERDEINPAEAAIVKECARRVLAGDPLRSVLRWLHAEGITTSTGRPWSQQALRIMLMSGRIAGLREHRRQVVGKAVWDPIITTEEHEQLRAMLAANRRAPGSKVRLHYLSGFVYCSDCGEKNVKMRVCPQAGKLKYKCMTDNGGCNGRVIGLADLEGLIGSLMVETLADPRTLRELAAREADTSDASAALLERIESDERRLAMLQASLDDGDEDELPEVIASVRTIRRRITEARAELARLASLPAPARVSSLSDLAGRWDQLDLDQRQQLLGLFVERILIHPAKRGLGKFDPARVEVKWVA